jgi:hypothetical protein
MTLRRDLAGAKPEKTPRDMLLGGLIFRKVRAPAREVVFVKGVIEASEGLAVVFAESGGDLTVATLPCRERELDEILHDLANDVPLLLEPSKNAT